MNNKNSKTQWPAQGADSGSAQSQSVRVGYFLIAATGVLVLALLGWQSWFDYLALKRQHQVQVEESVWLTADQMALNLAVTSTALARVLDYQAPDPGASSLQVVQDFLPGVINVREVHLDRLGWRSPASWQQTAHRLNISGEAFGLDSDLEHNQLFWTLSSAQAGRFWVLTLDGRALASLVSARGAQGYVWLLEDAGRSRVLARQQDDRLVYSGNAPMSAEERHRVVVSAPVAGTLWQVRGLVDADYYHRQLGPLLLKRMLLLLGSLLTLLLVLWLLVRQLRSNRHLRASRELSFRHMQDTERRYLDVFQGVDMALCLVDLSALKSFIMRQGLHDQQALDLWLNQQPQQHCELLASIDLLEANQVALDLLQVDSQDRVLAMLRGEERIRIGGARYRLILAMINGDARLELETPMRDADGKLRYLWMVMRLPREVDELHAVTLSITDLTERRRIELAMREREQFWASVVRSLPDLVYIRDIHKMGADEFFFSNRSLALMLGYSAEEEAAMGPQYRTALLHPDDLEYMQVNRRLQQVLPDNQVLEWRVRWRHKETGWRWFSIRSKVFKRSFDGRVEQVIGFVRDAHVQMLARQAVQRSEARYRLMAENVSDIVWSTDSEFRTDFISPSVQHVLGYTPDYLQQHGRDEIIVGERYLEFMHELTKELRQQVYSKEKAKELRKQAFQRQIVADAIKADGRKCPLETRVSLMWNAQGRFLGLLGVARDITEQRRTENRLRMAATVFENTTGAVLVTDPAGYIVQVNENFTRITGYRSDQIVDQLPSVLTARLHEESFYLEIMRALHDQGRWEGEIWQQRKDGEAFPSWAGITAVHDSEGDLVSYVCFFVDISERKASEARIQSLAYYDVLTGLPNRTLFQDRLQAALSLAARRSEWVAILFLDLDRFKPINDSLGHAAGDSVLKDVARRLRRCVRESDTVARMGGDEFTILLSGLADHDAALSACMHVAEKVLLALGPAFVLQEREFFVSASIGIALAPQDGDEDNILLKNADTAMYHAKAMGKDTYQFYQSEMNARALERLGLENDLRRAVQERAFHLVYQPQFSCANGRLTGAEVLLRWTDPVRGSVSPADFIPIAEELGLIRGLGEWVLDQACQQLAQWRLRGYSMPRLAVNLSAMQFDDGQLVEQISGILERYQLPPQVLELELTESILLRNLELTMSTLNRLKDKGVHIAIDDFGTGYSALNYLKDFPIDTLKIDRGFIQAMRPHSRDARLAEAIVAMGRSLQLRVIAEGIETAEQYSLVTGFGCDEVQGFHLGRPIEATAFEACWLAG
ncbi:MAG: EAL domain-containing protein [Halopseudomonas sp.]|uniref:sensor domain-containing protein n=1 Tax=Halopseudomonas sp. TaxID=2901191 RepID=UPI0030034E1E